MPSSPLFPLQLLTAWLREYCESRLQTSASGLCIFWNCGGVTVLESADPWSECVWCLISHALMHHFQARIFNIGDHVVSLLFIQQKALIFML
jgi:hypothetical protein